MLLFCRKGFSCNSLIFYFCKQQQQQPLKLGKSEGDQTGKDNYLNLKSFLLLCSVLLKTNLIEEDAKSNKQSRN